MLYLELAHTCFKISRCCEIREHENTPKLTRDNDNTRKQVYENTTILRET